MAMVAGEMSGTQSMSLIFQIEWEVDEVQQILQRDGQACQSGDFEFCGGDWTFKMIRSVESRMIQCLCIYIQRRSTSSHKNNVQYKVIKTNSVGEEHLLLEYENETDKSNWDYWVIFDLSGRNFSWSEKTAFHLKVVCTLECFKCKSEDMEHIRSRKRDVQELSIGDEGGDLIINVKDKLFRVHKSVLRERSPVFDAMFRHDMLEKKTGEVNITDCKPEDFHKFLKYLYFNQLDIVDPDSMDPVYSLYPITDKYEVSEAKAECVKYMLENLDLETFCDIFTLSLRHEDTGLSESAHQFFADNSKAITRTHRWRAFLKRHPTAANDLLTRVGS